MNLVMQGQYSNACQQACCAMLAGVTIEEIIALVGEHRMGIHEHDAVFEKYGVGRENKATNITGLGRECLGRILKDNQTLMLSIYDGLDFDYAHAVLYHEGDFYDPWAGINANYPLSRHISLAYAIRSRYDQLS